MDAIKSEWKAKNKSHQSVKRIIRNQRRADTVSLYTEIGNATENDQALLAKLVKLQKEGKIRNATLLIDDLHITEEDDIREQWASYFHKLGTPKITDAYLDELLEKARYLMKNNSTELVINVELVKEAVRSLNSGKADDICGISAEQLKALPEEGYITLTTLTS